MVSVACWGVVSLYHFGHAAETPMTQKEVLAFLKNVETATQKRDFIAVGSFMAPGATIELHFNGQPPTKLTREQYVMNAVGGASQYSNYFYKSVVKDIQFKGKTKAVVSAHGYERVTSDEHGTIYCMMNQKTLVEKLNGKLMITHYAVNGKMTNQKLF